MDFSRWRVLWFLVWVVILFLVLFVRGLKGSFSKCPWLSIHWCLQARNMISTASSQRWCGGWPQGKSDISYYHSSCGCVTGQFQKQQEAEIQVPPRKEKAVFLNRWQTTPDRFTMLSFKWNSCLLHFLNFCKTQSASQMQNGRIKRQFEFYFVFQYANPKPNITEYVILGFIC